MLLDVLMKPFAFSAEHDGGRRIEYGLVVEFCPTLVETVDPEAALFEVIQRAGDVNHTGNREILERARCSAINRLGQRSRAPLRHNNGISASCMRRTDNRSQIMRILHSVKDHDQPSAFDERLQVSVCMRRTECEYSLVRRASSGAIKRLAGFKTNRYRCDPG